MELDQVVKQLDWLDEEHRKDKTALERIEQRLTVLEDGIPSLSQQIKELSGEIARFSALLGRMDHFDEALLQQRVETKQALDALDKETKKREEEAEKVRRVELRALEEAIEGAKRELASLGEIKRGLQARVDEEARLNRAIDELRLKLDSIRRSEEEHTRVYRLVEDGRQQDAKRLADLQGEVTALRKTIDEQRGKMELTAASLRKIETRLNELSLLEVERRDAQIKFLENQALIQVERDRVWKEWQARFETIERQTADLETSLQALDATHRAVKRSQEALEELGQLVERRINEMAEIQRLAEERFRQEWVTFKADDQKRWTNYTLTQEEQKGEIARQFERLSERVIQMEDRVQEIQDTIQQINQQMEKGLQSLLAALHEWTSSYERSLGRGL